MICTVKERDMKALAGYQDQLMKNPRIRYIFFELTDQCNLRCIHCGSSCEQNKGTYLDYGVIERTLCSIRNEYLPRDVMVCLIGGEPFLHPDIFQIISTARTMGFPVGITTNGTLITDDKAKKLSESGLNTIAVSIDGLKEIHDAFRRCPGCFDRTIRGVKALKRNGIEPEAITIVSKMNLHQLRDLGKYLIDEGFYSWRITCMDPIGRADEHRDLLLSRNEIRSLLQYVREMRYDPDIETDINFGCSHFLSYEFEREVRDFYFQCGAGLFAGSVMANGDISACLDIERRKEFIQGNAYRDDFLTVWKEKFGIFRYNRAETSSFCHDCRNKEVCRGDSAHTWDFDHQEPRYCFARERKDA